MLSEFLTAFDWSLALSFCARASNGCNLSAAQTMAEAPSARFSFSGPEAAATAASCVALPAQQRLRHRGCNLMHDNALVATYTPCNKFRCQLLTRGNIA